MELTAEGGWVDRHLGHHRPATWQAKPGHLRLVGEGRIVDAVDRPQE